MIASGQPISRRAPMNTSTTSSVPMMKSAVVRKPVRRMMSL